MRYLSLSVDQKRYLMSIFSIETYPRGNTLENLKICKNTIDLPEILFACRHFYHLVLQPTCTDWSQGHTKYCPVTHWQQFFYCQCQTVSNWQSPQTRPFTFRVAGVMGHLVVHDVASFMPASLTASLAPLSDNSYQTYLEDVDNGSDWIQAAV